MPYDAFTTETMKLDGVVFTATAADPANSVERLAPDLPAAFAGTVTARTDGTSGVVTTTGAHTILEGKPVGVFFDGGQRMGMIAGVIAGKVIPVSAGDGAGLPPIGSAVTISPVVAFPFTPPVNPVAVGLQSPRRVGASLLDSGGGSQLEMTADDGAAYLWRASSGLPVPYAGPVGKARFANGEVYPTTPQLAVAFNPPA